MEETTGKQASICIMSSSSSTYFPSVEETLENTCINLHHVCLNPFPTSPYVTEQRRDTKAVRQQWHKCIGLLFSLALDDWWWIQTFVLVWFATKPNSAICTLSAWITIYKHLPACLPAWRVMHRLYYTEDRKIWITCVCMYNNPQKYDISLHADEVHYP